MKEAPLFRESFIFADWLLQHFGERQQVLAQSLCKRALEFCELITLALKDFDRLSRAQRADEVLILLRLQLRLAAQGQLLSEAQMLHALKSADSLGRQLGGWLKRLERESL